MTSAVQGYRWEDASGPSRVVITRQRGERFLVYQSCLNTYQRLANWDGFVGIEAARRWVRSQGWPPNTEVVEN